MSKLNESNREQATLDARIKDQELKFVEWSETANAEDYDIHKILLEVRRFKQEQIHIFDDF
jgi:hypothetical protein